MNTPFVTGLQLTNGRPMDNEKDNSMDINLLSRSEDFGVQMQPVVDDYV